MNFLQKFTSGLVLATAVVFSGAASAANSSTTLTADNAFWLYNGDATGSNLQFIGAGDNWQIPNSFSFDLRPGDYLYVLAYDSGQPHSWQGVFDTPDGTIYSNATSWVAYNIASGFNFGATDIQAVLAGATWGPINSELPNNSGPWGSRVGGTDTKWIWSSDPNSGDTAVLFRTTNVAYAVPEPETYAMLLAGLGVLGVVARRRKSMA